MLKYVLETEIDADAMLISDFNYFGSVVGGENSVCTYFHADCAVVAGGRRRSRGGVAQHVSYRVSRECCALGAGWHFWRPEQMRLVEKYPMGNYPSYIHEGMDVGRTLATWKSKIGLVMPCCIACAPGLVCQASLSFSII